VLIVGDRACTNAHLPMLALTRRAIGRSVLTIPLYRPLQQTVQWSASWRGGSLSVTVIVDFDRRNQHDGRLDHEDG